MSIPDEWKFPGRDYPAAKDYINSLCSTSDTTCRSRRSGRPTGTRTGASVRTGRVGGRGMGKGWFTMI